MPGDDTKLPEDGKDNGNGEGLELGSSGQGRWYCGAGNATACKEGKTFTLATGAFADWRKKDKPADAKDDNGGGKGGKDDVCATRTVTLKVGPTGNVEVGETKQPQKEGKDGQSGPDDQKKDEGKDQDGSQPKQDHNGENQPPNPTPAPNPSPNGEAPVVAGQTNSGSTTTTDGGNVTTTTTTPSTSSTSAAAFTGAAVAGVGEVREKIVGFGMVGMAWVVLGML